MNSLIKETLLTFKFFFFYLFILAMLSPSCRMHVGTRGSNPGGFRGAAARDGS